LIKIALIDNFTIKTRFFCLLSFFFTAKLIDSIIILDNFFLFFIIHFTNLLGYHTT